MLRQSNSNDSKKNGKIRASLFKALLLTYGWTILEQSLTTIFLVFDRSLMIDSVFIEKKLINFFISFPFSSKKKKKQYGFIRMIEPIFLGRFIFHINLHREEQFIRNKPQNGSSFSNSSSVNQTYLPSFVADQPINWLSFLAISTTNHLHNAYFFAALLCSTIMINFVISHPYFMENFRTGLHVRVGLTRLIYEKALKVSNTAVQRNTIGRIVNLISTDASRFDICFTAVYFFYCAIIHCAVGMFFLYIYLEELSLLNTKGNHSM